jgi:uncharacterized protein YcfJ
MKKIALTIGLIALSTTAIAEQALVVDVEPVYGKSIQHEDVVVMKEVCKDNRGFRDSNGLLERGVDGGFGSTQGLIGTAAGVAIVDELGGNDAAKIIGGLLGNKIGNDFKEKKKRSGALCWQEQVVERQSYWAKTITGYKVDVELGNSIYTVRRKNEPYIGQYLPVRVSVQ